MAGPLSHPAASDAVHVAPDVFSRRCGSRLVLQDITGRWGGLTLAALRDGPVRFNALRRRVDGISDKVLAQTLRTLERDGFVVREAQSSLPARVEYRLTDLGVSVSRQLARLIDELETAMDDVTLAQRAYDAR